ncbi:hypothetical protein M446_6197 [Methylobacterium sp. 4-46]|uniref:hypothetical protein n=1 Tax=unclassified Methylobacterium TaxID=2615210 RepID=UPI000152D888|nr:MULTISPECIES: hypothetical protein [Methylobacterium]ACA20465.1 hypothetical protein M446_6197 [Methylobacterium sp. 4-46]WFT79633.1 hypothetical protein QA634_31275 [Methylobacterium nodulans]
MFSIGPFHRSAGQPAGIYTSLLPLEPEPLETEAAGVPAVPAPVFRRHALVTVLLVVMTLAVQSAVGWWTLPSAPRDLSPSALAPTERAPS